MVSQVPAGVRNEVDNWGSGGLPTIQPTEEPREVKGPSSISIEEAKNLKRVLLGLCGKSTIKSLDEMASAFLMAGLPLSREGALRVADSLCGNNIIYGATLRGQDRILYLNRTKGGEYSIHVFVDDEESGDLD